MLRSGLIILSSCYLGTVDIAFSELAPSPNFYSLNTKFAEYEFQQMQVWYNTKQSIFICLEQLLVNGVITCVV